MKKILVAVDHSLYSLKAANIGVLFARGMHASISFVHVLETSKSHREDSFLSPEIISSMKANAVKLISRMQDIFSCPEAQAYVEEGNPHQRIRRTARILESDVIVIGLHGSSAMSKDIGGVTDKILRKTKVPVLIVPFKSVDAPQKSSDEQDA